MNERDLLLTSLPARKYRHESIISMMHALLVQVKGFLFMMRPEI